MKDEIIAKARARLQQDLLAIEKRTDISDDEKVKRIIVTFSSVCAAIAVQPIPFADIFILTPLQAFMGTRISAIRGMPMSEVQSADLVKQVMAVAGMGMVAQQLGIAAAKIFFPMFGGVATIPVVFSLTYGIGRVMDLYLTSKAAGRPMNSADLKSAWKAAKAEGQTEGRSRESEINKTAKADGQHESVQSASGSPLLATIERQAGISPSVDTTPPVQRTRKVTRRLTLAEVLGEKNGATEASMISGIAVGRSQDHLSLHEKTGVQPLNREMANGPYPSWTRSKANTDDFACFHSVWAAGEGMSLPFGFVMASFTDVTYLSHLYALAGRLELDGYSFEEQCHKIASFLKKEWGMLTESQKLPYLQPDDAY